MISRILYNLIMMEKQIIHTDVWLGALLNYPNIINIYLKVSLMQILLGLYSFSEHSVWTYFVIFLKLAIIGLLNKLIVYCLKN